MSAHAGVLSNKPSIVLHHGPTSQHPTLATYRSDKWGRPDLRPPHLPRPDGPRENDVVEQMVPSLSHREWPTYTFEVDLLEKALGEHGSNGAKVMIIKSRSLRPVIPIAGCWYDYPGQVQCWRESKERDNGVASDGTGNVALVAQNAAWSITKGFRCTFMGAGLTGMLGEE